MMIDLYTADILEVNEEVKYTLVMQHYYFIYDII